jgi:hypothetical protein
VYDRTPEHYRDDHLINNHLFRQDNFLSECYRQLIIEQTQSQSKQQQTYNWTVHIDTDEYLVPNP